MRTLGFIIFLNLALAIFCPLCFSGDLSGAAVTAADNSTGRKKHNSGKLTEQANRLYAGMDKEQARLFASCAKMKRRACAEYYGKYIKKTGEQ